MKVSSQRSKKTFVGNPWIQKNAIKTANFVFLSPEETKRYTRPRWRKLINHTGQKMTRQNLPEVGSWD
jgi:hypothetical protein